MPSQADNKSTENRGISPSISHPGANVHSLFTDYSLTNSHKYDIMYSQTKEKRNKNEF